MLLRHTDKPTHPPLPVKQSPWIQRLRHNLGVR